MHNFTSKCIFCVMPLVRTRKFEYTIQRHATNHGSPYHHPCLPTHSRSAQVPLLISALFLLPWSINDGVFGTILDWISTSIKPQKNTIRCNYFAPVPTVHHATRKVNIIEDGIKARDRHRDPQSQGHLGRKEDEQPASLQSVFQELSFLLCLLFGPMARDDHIVNMAISFMSCVQNAGYSSRRKTQTYININITRPQKKHPITTRTNLQPYQPILTPE